MSIEHVTRKLNRLRRVAHFIDANLFDPITLDDLADVALMSRYHFERVFSDYSGHTPLARVRHLRLIEARRRLAGGEATSILTLALDCGYSSAEAFSRAFKAQFGHAPSAVAPQDRPDTPDFCLQRLPALEVQYIPYAGQIDESMLPFDELRARAMLQNIPRERRKGWAIHLAGNVETWSDRVELQAALLSERLGARIPGTDQGHLPAGDYAVFAIAGGYDAPPRTELARRIASESEWRIGDGPVLRCFDNASYLPAQHEKRFQLYVPIVR